MPAFQQWMLVAFGGSANVKHCVAFKSALCHHAFHRCTWGETNQLCHRLPAVRGVTRLEAAKACVGSVETMPWTLLPGYLQAYHLSGHLASIKVKSGEKTCCQKALTGRRAVSQVLSRDS